MSSADLEKQLTPFELSFDRPKIMEKFCEIEHLLFLMLFFVLERKKQCLSQFLKDEMFSILEQKTYVENI